MASGASKVPLIQQNGSPIMTPPSGPQLRPQFRRQGSSFGGAGHVAPMAVMVVPSKIDYSVTKGGLRMWAVLFVFIFLCSSLYTLFSAKELAELAVDIDGDGTLDLDGEIDDDADEVANQNRRSEKDTTPSKENTAYSRTADELNRAHSANDNIPETADDEVDDEEPSEEEVLFAGLRAKVAEHRAKNEADDEDLDDGDEDEGEPVTKTRKDTGGREIKRYLKDDDDDDEEDEQEERKGEESGRKHESKRDRRRRAAARQEEEEEEEKEEDNEEDAEKAGEDGNGGNGDEKKDEHIENAGKGEKKTAEEDDDEADDQQERNGQKVDVRTSRRKLRRQPEQESKRICKRKNCPPAYDHLPRMELLKQKPQGTLSRRNKRYAVAKVEDEDLEDFDEFEQDEGQMDDDDQVDDNEGQQQIREVAAVKKQRLTGRAAYKRHAITNREDHRFRLQLDKADFLVEKHQYAEAFSIFDGVLKHNEDSPRAHFGKARAWDIRSEIENDVGMLDRAIHEYQEVLDIDDTPDALFRQSAYRLIDRARFRGSLHKVLVAQRSLIDRYPDEVQLQNDFGVTFLMMGRNDDALKIFSDVLQEYPENGVAQAYYGYILKLQGDFQSAVLYMRKGLRAARQTIADPRFYYHFGDALMRLGRGDDAHRVYNVGAKIGLFLSAYQRSLYNFEGLTARPWWTIDQTTYSKHLKNIERQWIIIREEAMNILEGNPESFQPEDKEMTIGGQWSAIYLYKGGSWNKTACSKMPKSCDILKEFRDSSNSSKNQIKISLLTSGSRVWPHCGYSNCRLQAHLGLVIPSEARIRVADEIRGWKTGRFIVFDDSFEHEIWFDGASANKFRLVLALDLWHPEIDPYRRINLGSNFL